MDLFIKLVIDGIFNSVEISNINTTSITDTMVSNLLPDHNILFSDIGVSPIDDHLTYGSK